MNTLKAMFCSDLWGAIFILLLKLGNDTIMDFYLLHVLPLNEVDIEFDEEDEDRIASVHFN